MNEFRAMALSYKEGRTPVFESALKTIEHISNPWILEIGGFRGEIPENISGDGFSIFYWAEFLLKKGSGKLTIVDIDPIAISKTKAALFEYEDKVNIEYICADGLEYLQKLNKINSNPNFCYLDGPDFEWFTYECFRLLNRTQTAVLCDDANGWEIGRGKCVRLRRNYVHYTLHKVGPTHEMIYYPLVTGNEKAFQIGKLELDYVRENVNTAWRNCRSVELALGKWFIKKYNNDILEVGDVTCQYSFFNGHTIVDPFGPYEKCIRKSAELVDYTGLNVLTISTLEHFNSKEYKNNDDNLGIKVLRKIHEEAKNYLITIPVGGWRPLEDFLTKQSDIKYTFLQRGSYRSDTNNWTHQSDKDLFYLPYFHFDYCCGYFGCAGAVVVITNQPEILIKL